MSDQVMKLIIGAALLLHGLGHGGALGALVWIVRRPGTDIGGWQAARSWLLSALPAPAATAVASVFWVAALTGFAVAALSFWGILLPAELWRPVAVASALVSITSIMLFLGTWPVFNTLAALGMNIAVLVAVLWFHWPSEAQFGT